MPIVNSTVDPERDTPAHVSLDLRMVHEEISAALALHEPVAPGVVEELHRARELPGLRGFFGF